MDKRPESRVSADIPVRIWGMDADGKPFFQSALAGSLSSEGAQLSHLRHNLKIGDIIGIQYGVHKARFKVVWAKGSAGAGKNQVGVMILNDEVAPWMELANEKRREGPRPEAEKRRFSRHRVQFPMAISFSDPRRAHMQCSATDIGGRGCYVETLVPLAIGSPVIITFWLDSRKIRTNAVVRTSDPGVGMGIEFTELGEQIQHRLQEYLEKVDEGFKAAAESAKSGA
jgi:PilZ domain